MKRFLAVMASFLIAGSSVTSCAASSNHSPNHPLNTPTSTSNSTVEATPLCGYANEEYDPYRNLTGYSEVYFKDCQSNEDTTYVEITEEENYSADYPKEETYDQGYSVETDMETYSEVIPEVSPESEPTPEPTPEVVPEYATNGLQEALEAAVANELAMYPGATFAVGVYDIQNYWCPLAEYNPYASVFSGCQVKLSFCTFVLEYCEREGIDIFNTYINGSSIYDLLYDTLQWSNVDNENRNYGLLVDYFGLENYMAYQNEVGGQYISYGVLFGSTTIGQKLNEWRHAYGYMYGGSYYGSVLANLCNNTNFSYIAEGMYGGHWFMHKSGWSDDDYYYCAGDSAIVDGRYFVTIQSMNASVSSVRRIASAIEPYLYS